MRLWSFQVVVSSPPSRNFFPLRLKSGQVSNKSLYEIRVMVSKKDIVMVSNPVRTEPSHVIDIQERLNMMRHGRGCFLVFSGFDGTQEELGLQSTNFWLFKNNDMDKS